MKTHIKKIIVGAAALLFVMTGISFAHDGGSRHHKPHGKAHGYYKVKKDHHKADHRHYKPWKNYRKGHARRDVHHRHWKKSYSKYNRSHHDRYHYRKARHHHRDKHSRRSPREDLIYKIDLKDPGIVFKLILKDY